MATYVYKFADGSMIEVQQAMTDQPFAVLVNPLTGLEETVKRVPSLNTNPVFKGSGFYKTDRS